MTQNALVPRQEYQPPAAVGLRENLTRFVDEFGRAWFHRGLGLLVAWLVAFGAAAIVLALPDKYSARAQVYVNTESLLRPLLKGLAVDPPVDQQVQVLQKTLLTDVNLSKVLVQLDDEMKQADRATFAEAIEDLRSQIKVDGGGNQLFSISYDGIVPDRARQVVQSLLTIFIESNLGQSRTDMQTARDFVDQQIARYEQQLRETDQKLAKFRIENAGIAADPAYSARIQAVRRDLDDATIEIQSAKEVKRLLEARLSTTEAVLGEDTPPPQIVVGDQLVVTAIDRINTLRAQLQALRLRYTDDHPDVIASRDALNALIKQYSGAGDPQSASKGKPKSGPTNVMQVGTTTLSGGTPRADIGASGSVATPGVTAGSGSGAGNASYTPNPEYGEIQVQLVKTKLAMLEAEQKAARARATLETLELGSKVAPEVEAEFSELTRGYDVIKKNYLELLARRESARMSQAVDTSVDVVQFRVVEPPVLPAKPSGPNRAIFLIIGTLLALAAGAGAAFLRGVFHDAVVSAKDLQDSFGLPVVASLGPSEGIVRRFRVSAQAVSMIISVSGIVAAMTMVGFLSPYLSPLRLLIYQALNNQLHVWG
jgi:uncharacterized protein involved in exopolysaccharide biosynthesis